MYSNFMIAKCGMQNKIQYPKGQSDVKQTYYTLLELYEHFIPLVRDLDYIDKLGFYKDQLFVKNNIIYNIFNYQISKED